MPSLGGEIEFFSCLSPSFVLRVDGLEHTDKEQMPFVMNHNVVSIPSDEGKSMHEF